MFHTEEELKIPLNSCLSEIAQGAPTIRAYGKTNLMLYKSHDHIHDFCGAQNSSMYSFRKLWFLKGMFSSILTLLSAFFVGIVKP